MGLKKTFARNFVCQTENPLQMAAILLVVSAPAQLHKLSAADGGGEGLGCYIYIYIRPCCILTYVSDRMVIGHHVVLETNKKN